ncbi:cysteine proteinase [Wallemia mellicola]|nr:hypothetical protein E3Q24_00817 [Wallemia mellicola]TIB90988.1 cysteine proteinase [Wallemia mellicola]TIB92656.1 cysteine proteinase [Wallemia mellicola]TIC14769.1 cysteine proteinase [Wallemia mellicola]TIC16627.1 cysteine proteinase [Wallemia mellicola]
MSSLFKRLGIVSKDLESLSNGQSKALEAALLKDNAALSPDELNDRYLERFYGMDNLGNSCYCNSVLQSLYFCRPLRELVLALPSDVDKSMYTVLRGLFQDISTQPKRTGVIQTKSFVEKLRQENELFRSTTHQDAHEFLNYLLNRVAEDLTRLTKSSHTLVHSLFEGTLTNETKCMTCENITHRDESFLDLSINVEEDSNVTECLSNFSVREMLCQKNKFFCDSCGGLQEAEKWMRIKKLPNILALHLKRFKYQEDQSRYIKLSYRVAFPFLLEPGSLSSTCQGAENSDKMYRLFAVIIHIGSGPHHGHYVSIIKSYDRWVLFDDDKVSVVDEHELSKFFGNDPAGEGYVFFYETVDLDRTSVGLPATPPPQVSLAKEEEETPPPSKGSYLKKKGSFSAPPSPNLTAVQSPKVNSSTKLNQVVNATDDNHGKTKDAVDVKRSMSQSSRRSASASLGLNAEKMSSRRPSSSGSLFSKKERVSSRPSTSHGASPLEKEKSWFGSISGKMKTTNGYIPPEIPSQKPRVRSDSIPHKRTSEEVKRNRRRSATYSSSTNTRSTSTTPPSNSQFANGMPATFVGKSSSTHSSEPERRKHVVSPPPPLTSGKLSAAQLRREKEPLGKEKVKSPPPPAPMPHFNNDSIGSSPQHYHPLPAKPAKKNIISKWIDKIRH